MYAELHAWSNFTFLDGGSHPEELVDRAAELGLAGIALTDRDGLYGMVRFAARAKERKIPGIVGGELTFEDGAQIVLLVESAAGYANLCELISLGQLRGAKSDARLRVEDFEGRCEGLIALSGGPNGRAERALAADGPERAAAEIRRLRGYFGDRFFLELQHHLTAGDVARNERLAALGRELGVPCVATNGVVYAYKDDARLADILTCVRLGTTIDLAHEHHQLRPNAEYHLKPARAMRRLFARYPDAIARSVEIASRCAFRLERIIGQFPLFPVDEGKTRQSYLRELVYQGAAERYGTPPAPNVERQLEYELGMIARMDLAGYFLIVWDIVKKAAELGVLCQGRG
ncbi:MAG TPA: PHP domain-containing protein, partial [Candidatus Tumulicola sp.]